MTRSSRRGSAKVSSAKGTKPTARSRKQTRDTKSLHAFRKSRKPQRTSISQSGQPSLEERLQAERDRLFKAVSIIECCKYATASLMHMSDSEYMVPAFEAACDLLETSAEELGRIVDESAGRNRSRRQGIE